MTQRDLEDILYTWLCSVVTVPIVWDYGNGPRPTEPFIALHWLGTVRKGSPGISPVNASGERTFNQYEEHTLAVQGYGDGCFDRLQTVRNSIYTLSDLEQYGVVVQPTKSVRDVSAVIDTSYERRAVLDITVSVIQSWHDKPGVIEHIPLQETIKKTYKE
jgi:hypothetical protein